MAEGSSVEISIGTDPAPETPGASIRGNIEIGGSEAEAEQTRLAEILGGDFTDLTAYGVLACTSAEAATGLAEKLSNIWQEASNSAPTGPLSMVA